MKKLVLLVSVFLLVAGMVAADVTFAPTVSGSTSVTWGMDFKAGDNEVMDSGFDTASATSLDLGVTIDPVDAKGGEGIYGEVAISGLAVTAKSGADVAVAAPAIAAKLWFSEALYAWIDTDGVAANYAQPLGALVSVDDEKQEGTWFDSGEDYNGATVYADYGNAGYGFTYMAGDLTANLSFVSKDEWGESSKTTQFKWADYDNGGTDGIENNKLLNGTELTALKTAAFGLGNEFVDVDGMRYTLVVKEVLFEAAAANMYEIETDGDYVVFQKYDQANADLDDNSKVDGIDYGVDEAKTSLYTASLDVAYTLTDVGTFKAYVAPTHTNHAKLFTGINFGVEAAVALASFDMVGLTVGADMALNNAEGVADTEKFEWELAVAVPVKVGDMLTANLKAATTDAKDTAGDNMPLDLYADATLMAAGATVKAAYQVSDFAEAGSMSQSYEASASYPVAVGAGTVTPMVMWEHDCKTPWDGIAANEGLLTASVAAAIIDNVTFTAKYASGDLFVAEGSKIDAGVFTFETKFAY